MGEMKKAYICYNSTGPTEAVSIDPEKCVGCNHCVNICRVQTIMPNSIPGKPPILVFPDECWYCGCCVEACETGALQMRLPMNQRILYKRKETGEVFRLGEKEAPEKSYFKMPYGWRDETDRY